MTTNHLIRVNEDQCTRCGLCVKVCRGTLAMGENGPVVAHDFCIACGHCTAICPSGALDHVQAPLSNQILLEKSPVPDADTAARFLRSRRSVRSFQKKVCHVKRSWNCLTSPGSRRRPVIPKVFLTTLSMIRMPYGKLPP